jgi:ABC-type nitrate/sulfonate/bicarbonate transport system permease component
LRLLQPDMVGSTVAPSLYRLAIGFAVGVSIGAIAGLILGYFRWIDPWVRPFLEYLRFIPAVAILPAAILLFGPTDFMRIFVITFGCIFPVLLAAMDGARRVEPLLIDVAIASGRSKVQQLAEVILPASLPAIFAGIRIALGMALIMMVLSELIAAENGIGYDLLRNQRLFRTANVYAGVLLIGTLGWVLTAMLLRVEKHVLGWHRGSRKLAAAG